MPATDADRPVEVRVLGPLEVTVDGSPVALGGVRPRGVLAVLAVDANRVVPAERIVDAVWGDDVTHGVQGSLHVHVSNLRRSLAPAAERLGQKDLIVTERPGYVLRVPAECHDLMRAEALVAEARELAESSPSAAIARYDDALRLWRGEPLADLASQPFAVRLALRATALRESVVDDRLELALSVGRHFDVLTDLADAVAADPTNERRRGLLMLALYRAGRQADALATYQEGRRVLVDELGVEPSPALRELEGRILAQDPTLAVPRPATDRNGGRELSTVLGSSILAPEATLLLDGSALPITKPVTSIGRRHESDVVVDDPKASRAHAEIRVVGAQHILVDRGSTNGTYVNGSRVIEHALAGGDEVRIGATVMTFICDRAIPQP